MRHSVFVKFLAVFLCAAALLGAVGSGLGIFLISELDLRNQTPEEAYEEATRSTLQSLASDIGVRAWSQKVGGATEYLIDDYYGTHWLYSTFDWSQVGYTVADDAGAILDQRVPEGMDSGWAESQWEITDSGYLKVLSTMTMEEYDALHNLSEPELSPAATVPPSREPYIYNEVPVEGVDIGYIHVVYSDGSEGDYGSIGAADTLGTLSYYTSNQLMFICRNYEQNPAVHNLITDIRYTGLPVSMLFADVRGVVVCEISNPASVLEEFSENHGVPYFLLATLEEAVELSPGNVYDVIPHEGIAVSGCSIAYADHHSESTGGSPEIGFLYHDALGNVIFRASYPELLDLREETITFISFKDEKDLLIYSATNEAGVGRLYLEDDLLIFTTAPDAGTEESQPSDEPDIYIYDDVPPREYPVYTIELWLPGGSGLITVGGGESPVGFAGHDDSGNVFFRAADWKDFVFSKPADILYIRMIDQDGRKLYEAWEQGAPMGSGCVIGAMGYNSQNQLVFSRVGADLSVPAPALSEPQAEPTAPEEAEATEVPEEPTEPVQVPEETAEPSAAAETQPDTTSPTLAEERSASATQETVPPTEPVLDSSDIPAPANGLHVYSYYDHSIQENMVAEYTFEDIPGGSVTLVLGPGALQNQNEWILVDIVWQFRDHLIPGLIGCLLLFAVTAVYLCCAAGRRPRTQEVRAGGLNRIPLDLYLAGACTGIFGCLFLLSEAMSYLLQQDIQVWVLVTVLTGYGACLLSVGFCFAFAAQVKTPGGFWWRNSFCGLMLKILAWLWKKFLKYCGWLWDKYDEVLLPGFVRLCKALWKLTLFFLIWLKRLLVKLFTLLKKAACWLTALTVKGMGWLGRTLSRFLSMLPLTWQFLLIGFSLVVFLYIMIRTYKVGYILIGFGIFFGVILYAASAFAILLENAKRMRKGDLDTKVDDRLLIGGFRDFAEELNGLADVAVVAAQKQLKSERMKTELITNVSHDIKTPLTSIINYVDLLEKPHSPEQQQTYLEVLSRQSLRLKKLIDDLMEMSKASTGNMEVDITRVNAVEAVNQALGEFADKLEKAQLIPVFRQPESDIFMMADGRLVWRVLSNLLSNAAKYAMPGTRLYIDLMELEGKVVLSLKNISRDSLNIHADELLERFVRGDTARNTEGSGLGLNIAQSLMQLQKGRLEILVDGDLFKVTLIFPGA